jgi:hypothetical protein
MDAETPIVMPEPLGTPAGLFVHWCEHQGCKEWGCFGYETRYGTLWVCGEHRDEGERMRR